MSDHPGDEKPRSSIFSSSSKPEDKGGEDKDKKDEKPASSLFGGTKSPPSIFASTKTGTSSAAPADKDKDKPGDPARSTGTNPPFGSRPPATGSNPFSSTRSTGTGGPLGSSSSTGAFNKPGQPPSSSGSGGSKGTPLGTAYDKALGDKKPDQGGAKPDEKKPEPGGSKPAEASKSSAFSFTPKPATSTPAEKKPDDKKGEDNKPNEPAKPAGGGLFGRLGAKPTDPEKKPDDKKPADGDKKPDAPAKPAIPVVGNLFNRPKPADPEKKLDDKKPSDGDPKPDQKPAEPAKPSGGGLFGRLGAKPADPEKKPDDKKPAEPAKPSGATASGIPKLATGAATPPPAASAAPKDEKKPDPAPAAAPKPGGLNLFNRGGAKPPEPEKKAAEPPKPETSASAAPKIGPVAAKVDAKKDDKKDAKPAEPSARRGFLGIFRRSKKPDVAALQQAAADRKALVTAAPRPAKPIEGGTQVKVNNPGLSLDQKLDMIGYAMIAAGIIMLFGVLQPDEGTFTKALVDILGALFGYGRFLIPLPALAVGGWLLVRHFKENPLLEFDVLQLLGSVMLFLTLVTGLHFLELLQKPVLNWEELVIVSNMAVDAMQGGGWVGDRLYMILIRLSGEWGVPVLILAALIVSSMLTFEITLAEISIYIKSIFQFFGRRVASIRLSLRLWNNQRKMRAAARMQARQAKAAQKAAARAVSKPAAGPGLPAAATLAGAALTDGNGNTDGKRVLPEPAMVAMPPNKVGAAAPPLRAPVPAGGTDDGPPPTLAPARPAPIRTGPSASPARMVAEAAPVTVAPDKADDLPLPTPALARPTPIRATGSTPAATGTAPEKPKSGGMFGPFGSRGKSEPAKPPESPKSEPIKAAELAKPEPAPVTAEPTPLPTATPAKPEPAPASSATSEKTVAASAAPSTPQPASEPESGTVKVLEAVKPEAPPEPVKAVSSAESVESDLEKTQPAEITGVMKPVTAADKPAEPSAPPVVEKTPPPVAKPSSIFGAFGRPAEKPATSTSTASAPTANAPTASAQSTEQTVPTERAEKTSPMGPVKPPVPQPTKPGGGLFGALGARTDKPATPPPAKPSEPPATPKADSAEAAKVTSATPPADPPKPEEPPLPPAKPAGIFGSRPPAFASTPPAFKPAPKPTGTAPKVDDPAAKAKVDEIADPPPADEVETISADAITPTAPIAPPPTVFKSGEKQPPPALGSTPKFAVPSRPTEPAAKPPAPEQAPAAPPAKPASSIFGAARPPFGGANKPAESAPPPVSKPAEPPAPAAESATPAAAPEPTPTVKSEPPKVPAPNPLPAISPTGWLMPNIQEVLEAGSQKAVQQEVINERSRVIEDTLRAFGAPGKVVEINVGPTITQFGVEPDYLNLRGGKRTRVKVGAIAKLDADLALALAARSIRIEAPVPGKGYVGIEVPNAEVSLVGLRDIMEDPAFMKVKSRLRIALGKSIDGTPVIADLTAMPHLLIAGTTGSGKSVCVNAIIACLLLQNSPDDLKFIMVDPKRVELTGYNGIPHLISPVVVDLERIVGVLKWVTREMDDRYKKFAAIQARNIVDYNGKIGENETKMPYLVIVIDELADLMMLAPDETERVLTRLAQMARATGIHLILSTQRPSVDVVTGLIKANFPARISFAVASSVDSRVILDQPGAEKLLGRGDMLYQAPDAAAPIRVQGVYVSDAEINRITSFWKGATSPRKDRVTPAVSFDQISEKPTAKPGGEREDRGPFGARPNRGGSPFGGPPPAAGGSASAAERDKFKDDFYNAIREPEKPTPDDLRPEDDVYAEAVELFRQTGRISVSLLQRRLKVNFNRAAKLIDLMKQRGVLDDTKLTEEE